MVTLTTVIWKVPEADDEQPDGAGASGATAVVTAACGIGFARAADATRAMEAKVFLILRDSEVLVV